MENLTPLRPLQQKLYNFKAIRNLDKNIHRDYFSYFSFAPPILFVISMPRLLWKQGRAKIDFLRSKIYITCNYGFSRHSFHALLCEQSSGSNLFRIKSPATNVCQKLFSHHPSISIVQENSIHPQHSQQNRQYTANQCCLSRVAVPSCKF